VSGVAETLLGPALIALLFLGPWPIAVSTGARAVGLTAFVVLLWDALFQVVIDAGYYNVGPERAGAILTAVRWLLPIAAAAAVGVMFAAPWWGRPVALGPAIAAAGSMLLLLPAAGAVNVLQQAAFEAAHEWAKNARSRSLDSGYSAVHRLIGHLRDDEANASSDADRLRIQKAISHARLEQQRLDALKTTDFAAGYVPHLVPDVVERTLEPAPALVAALAAGRLSWTDLSNELPLDTLSAQMLMTTVADLADNATRAADHTQIVVEAIPLQGVWHRVSVTVTDDGPGFAPCPLPPSLKKLRDQLEACGGGLEFSKEQVRGSRAIATFELAVATRWQQDTVGVGART
jgi:signal transduction histidine kinase